MDHDPNSEITVINTRGRVVHAKRWMLSDLRQQGMKVIVNPKREYYPEFDCENQRYNAPEENVTESVQDTNLLEVERIV